MRPPLLLPGAAETRVPRRSSGVRDVSGTSEVYPERSVPVSGQNNLTRFRPTETRH